LYGEGREFGGEVVRVIEEYPSTAAELLESSDLPKEIGLVWLRRAFTVLYLGKHGQHLLAHRRFW
jgi:hypothetical protein